MPSMSTTPMAPARTRPTREHPSAHPRGWSSRSRRASDRIPASSWQPRALAARPAGRGGGARPAPGGRGGGGAAPPPRHIAYSGPTRQVWVLNTGETSLRVLDGASAEPIGKVDLGGSPRHVILDDAAGLGYVSLAQDALAIVDIRANR